MQNRILSIISGATGGLGKQLALSQANNKTHLILLGRSLESLEQVKQTCESRDAMVSIICADLYKNTYQNELKVILDRFEPGALKKILLFNNASTIQPITMLVNTSFAEQENLLQVNLNSSIWLSSEVLRLVQRVVPVETYIVNLSSGVSLKPIQGWSLYCISKAAINMLTSCIAEETRSLPYKVAAVAINPGALDTEMQSVIRNSDDTQSPIAQKFRQMHEKGDLNNVKTTVLKILEILNSNAFESGQFLDFNNI